MTGQRLIDRRPLVEQLELEQRGLADEGLGARRVLDARQLDQDLIRALARDRGLAHTELIDAVADGLEPLTDGVVAQLAGAPLAHHEPEGSGRLIVVAPLERLELRHDGPGVVPRLGAGELDPDRGIALARDALDGDALALERRLEVLGRPIRLTGHVPVRLHAEHEVDPALQIEPEVDRASRRVQVPHGDDDHGDDEADAQPEVPRHPSRPAPP